MSRLVRISEEAYSSLVYVVNRTGASEQEVLTKALKNLERDAIFNFAEQLAKTHKEEFDALEAMLKAEAEETQEE